LLLVTQIYAPLSGSLYHRTLYIFGCIQTKCWNKSSSWACLRAQVRDKIETEVETKSETKSEPVVSVSATDWLDEADDWGDDPNDNDDNGNFSNISPDTSSPSPIGAVGGFPNSNLNLNDKLFNALDGDTTLDIPINNLNIKDDTSHAIAGKNLNDNNANMSSPGRGASAPYGTSVTNPAATAEIEMEGEDYNIAIDSPEVANTNIPHLFATATREVSSSGLKIEPFYIWVQEESLTPRISEHEMSLLMEYKAKEALDHVVESGKASKTGGGGDTYEKTVPSHGDEFFHKFISVIQNNPGQILRYGRESQSPPLLLRPLLEENQSCSHCGADTTFELQLLPSLVAQLSVAGLEGAPLEFGTVLVMACQNSCWSGTSNQPRFEKVLVQGELM
jgi:pre-rRNA-processing protein TSR4